MHGLFFIDASGNHWQFYTFLKALLLCLIPLIRIGEGKKNRRQSCINQVLIIYVYRTLLLSFQERFTQDMQPHYIYSPREMTRWVRGIVEALRPLETLSVEGLVRLWAHEALRLFQDR
jgi:hypothetical protein